MNELGRFPQHEAGEQARRLVRQVAVDVFGGAVVETPIPGSTVITDVGLDDPLTGVRAALLLRRIVDGQVLEHARAARAAGRSWDEIGAALELPAYEFNSRAAITFTWLVEGREPDPDTDALPTFRAPSTHWRCGACEQQITDGGPFESHPDDNETGHTPGCTRHQADVAAWAACTGWEDER